MTTTTRSRRTLALLACAGLAVTAASFPISPASATPITGQFQLQGTVNYSGSSPQCSKVGTVPNTATPFSHNGASGVQSMDVTVTNTDPTTPDPADHTRVTGNISASTHVAQTNNSMTSFNLRGSGQVSVTAAEGAASQCKVRAQMGAQSSFVFSEAKAGWLFVTRSQSQNMLSEMIVASLTGATPYVDAFGGPKSKHTERAFLKPGQYQSLNAFIVSDGALLGLKSATQAATLSGAFHLAGSALGSARGTGVRYLSFPAAVSCSQHSARLTWTSKAGQVKSGAFFVNGTKKASVSSPNAGGHVVLSHLSATRDAKVLVKLNLKGGGSASATRTYLACKG